MFKLKLALEVVSGDVALECELSEASVVQTIKMSADLCECKGVWACMGVAVRAHRSLSKSN